MQGLRCASEETRCYRVKNPDVAFVSIVPFLQA